MSFLCFHRSLSERPSGVSRKERKIYLCCSDTPYGLFAAFQVAMLNFDGSMGGTSIWCSSETKKTCQVLGSTMLAALKANLVPGICLLIMEVILIVLYFYCVECDQGFAFLSALKSEWGYIYSALATSFFGGLFPWGIGLVTNEVCFSRSFAGFGFSPG